MKKPLLITMGDPTGVGPEIIVQAAGKGAFAGLSRPVVVIGDLAIMKRAAQVCGFEVDWQPGSPVPLASGELVFSGQTLSLREISDLDPAQQKYGQPVVCSGSAMFDYISWACDRCLAKDAAGMVTAPINKQALQLAGADYPGHTELLATRCGVDEVVMMLAGERLKVCLVTTHIALRDVPRRLTVDRVLSTIRIAATSLRQQFGPVSPRLAVLALNPHAGEGGLFGDEETQFIVPAIETARHEGIDASGPHSADTLFWFAAQGRYDAVICMYHDQGLIPLKLLHFDDGVNVTLGLPIVRTSVDHGTAYDLAGSGKASPTSLIAAVKMADQMAEIQERGARCEVRGKP
jgi:4-hydroxythreonine-4-phosphate dehydrogenase